MKKISMLMAFAILFITTIAFASQANTEITNTTKTTQVKPTKVEYTCPMHPNEVSNKPGKCPKCGMTLVKKEPAKKKTASIKM